MLGVHPLRDPSGSYYLDEMDPPSGWDRSGIDGPPGVGRWLGHGARGLGLDGPVAASDLGRVLSGESPVSGHRLAVHPARVRAYDLTFSAPKSVSVLMALGPPEVGRQVLAAHDEAVDDVLGYVAQRAAAVRRGAGDERRSLAVCGVTAAAFTHRTSRALDPHLHSHVVVANTAQGEDGRWTALDGRGLFAHAGAIGALYDAQVRQSLSARLGVAWEQRSDSSEIVGLGPEVLGVFSQRQAEIRAHLAKRSLTSAGARRLAGAATRDPKREVRTEDLAEAWVRRAAGVGFGRPELEATLGRVTDRAPVLDEHRFAGRLMGGAGAVARRDVVHAWAASLAGGAPARSVDGCVSLLVSDGSVGVAEPGLDPARLVGSQGSIRVLGARPTTPEALGVWYEAAGSVERYGTRWGDAQALDPSTPTAGTSALIRFEPARLADHLRVSRQVLEARRALGRTAVFDRAGPDLGRG